MTRNDVTTHIVYSLTIEEIRVICAGTTSEGCAVVDEEGHKSLFLVGKCKPSERIKKILGGAASASRRSFGVQK